MKKETIITSLTISVLNLLWSLIVDLLPNIVDFSILPQIHLSHYLVFLIGLIAINSFALIIHRVFLRRSWDRDLAISHIDSAITQLVKEEAKNITERPPLSRPGSPQTQLSYYKDVLLQIKRANGSIEFLLENYRPILDPLKPIYLSCIEPGMSKYFMIVTQDIDSIEPEYLIIQPDFRGNPEECTYTWFDKILPILGNISDNISVKQSSLSNQPESTGCYQIFKHKVLKRKGSYFIQIPVC